MASFLDGLRTCGPIMESLGVTTILSVMLREPANAALQGSGASVLWSLSYNEVNAAEIMAASGLQIVMHAMQGHQADVVVQQGCCGLLANVAASEDNWQEVVEAGAVPLVLSAMTFFPEDERIQESGCTFLGHLATHDTSRTVLMDAGALPIVLNAMRQFVTGAEVQRHGCVLLHHLCSNRHTRARLVLAGGVQDIINAMGHHRGDVEIQRYGCICLAKMSLKNGPATELWETGGITVILEGMRVHPGEEAVQKYGCCVLGTLCDRQLNACHILESGGTALLLTAMQNHLDDPDVQRNGCRALWKLFSSLGEETNVEEVADHTVVETVVEAMRRHPTNPDVQGNGCMILQQLASSNTLRLAMITATAAITVLTTMHHHFKDCNLQAVCCGTLALLARGTAGQMQIGEAGGVETIVQVMREHTSHRSTQQSACAALRHLLHIDTNNDRFLAAGGVTLVLGAMEVHKQSATFTCNALKLFRVIGLMERGRCALQKADILPTVRQAIKVYGQDPNLKEAADWLLGNLEVNSISTSSSSSSHRDRLASSTSSGGLTAQRLCGKQKEADSSSVEVIDLNSASEAHSEGRLRSPGVYFREPVSLSKLLFGTGLPLTVHEAVMALDGLEFRSAPGKKKEKLKFSSIASEIDDCVAWAATQGSKLAVVRTIIGVNGMAALRVWTDTVVCHVVRFALRNGTPPPAAMPYLRLFRDSLHMLPRRYIYQGPIYRTEYPDGCHEMPVFIAGQDVYLCGPTAFSRDATRLQPQSGRKGPRTVMTIAAGNGYLLQEFSSCPDNDEVLVDADTLLQIVAVQRFDAMHPLVTMGEVPPGLQLVEATAPGAQSAVSLLSNREKKRRIT